MKTTLAIAAALTTAFAPSFASACCMLPASYEGSISQSGQEAIIFHDRGREELILKIDYRIRGKKMPDRFAWIITVPNEPDAYSLADRSIFEKTYRWADKHAKIPARSYTFGVPESDAPKAAVDLGRRVRVGPYDIQPVRARGVEALDGLNDWLRKNGFPTEDPEHMKYFVEKKFTFLCIKIVPAKGKTTVGSGAPLQPIHLSFKSEKPYYPLRFSSRQGVFDLNLYVLTKNQFDYESSSDSLRRIRFARGEYRKNVAVEAAGFPKLLREQVRKGRLERTNGQWFLNVLRTRRVNEGEAIMAWKEDIFFQTKSRA